MSYSSLSFIAMQKVESMMNSSPAILKRIDNIIKSDEDKRLYRGLLLSNNMKVLLVSDPATDKSAAALHVNVGYMSDPDNIPGLAHFCEHMLFLGTKKYPDENDYHKFLSEHGGSSNASTTTDHTNYYFDVAPNHLKETLDRFSQFFKAPLFTESATSRELNAVHSEHEKNLTSDIWRMDQLDKHTANSQHPYHKFGTGNKYTLDISQKENGVNVREALLKFHSTWYSSNIMSLAVLGKESLDELENIVVELFSEVENKDVEAPQWNEYPFGKEQLKTCTYMVPIKDLRNLHVIFPSPDLLEYYKSQPGNYISHLIGHEGPGSLLTALKERGWCNSLVAGNRPAPRGFGFFGISVDLTEEGIKHIDDIVKLIFQYIRMLKESGPLPWVHEEQRDILAMGFRFKDKESPRSYIVSLAYSLQNYPLEEVLHALYSLSDWRPDIIEKLLNDFNPDNIRIGVIAKQFANVTDKKEPWYGTDYKIAHIPEETINEWKSVALSDELRIPDKNEFIPTTFDLYPIDKDVTEMPVIIKDTPITRVWFKQDDKFLLPKANLMFDFVSPLAYLDPMNCNLTHMFVQLFRDALNQYTYAAEIAGLKYELSNTKYGLILSVGGFSDKQNIFLDKIMDKLTNFKVDPKRFEIYKENYIRSLKNFAAEQPYHHAVYYLAVLLTEHSWTKQELLAATDQLTVDRLEAFIPQILSKMHIECLLHGNVNKEKALELVEIVENRLTESINMSPLLPRQLLLNRELKLENGCNYLYEVQNHVHRSSCIELYYQCGLQNTVNNMMLELFAQIVNEPCFNVLRTKEQLGYIVFSGIRRSNGVQGLRIIVQSEKHPRYVDERIETFLLDMLHYITDMPEEEFTKHKEALAVQRLEKPKQLSHQSSIYWSEITSQQYHFDRATVEVAFLRTITKHDIIEFYKNLLAEHAEERHKIAVHVVSMTGAAKETLEEDVPVKDECQVIQDVTVFKSSHGMHPLVQPYINITRKGNKSKL
ncbi:nardilysin [Holotrichia oblita]|uniref:Nardilysin n=1 Tax=Holotrichia oblita TaxID=644536 RepID=A0ACB9SRI5_HOLOL|nr:nardilysin [Holotrichia oblita]